MRLRISLLCAIVILIAAGLACQRTAVEEPTTPAPAAAVEEAHEHGAEGHEAAAAAAPATGPLDEKLGAALAGVQLVPVEVLIKDPASYEGRVVRLEGQVVDMCFHRHGWFGLASADGAKVVRVLTAPRFQVPAGALGSRVVTEGVVKMITLQKEQLEHYREVHKFVSEEELKAGGPVRQVLVTALGAEFKR